jgi:hypothetical protein
MLTSTWKDWDLIQTIQILTCNCTLMAWRWPPSEQNMPFNSLDKTNSCVDGN